MTACFSGSNKTKILDISLGERAMAKKNPGALHRTDQSSKPATPGTKIRDRISRLESAKSRAKDTQIYLEAVADTPHLHSIAHRMSRCANYLVFNHYYTIDELRLVHAMTCQVHMLCPFCARQRAARLVDLNLRRFTQVLSENPSSVPVHLVLTVKNGPDLQERFNHLHRAFRKLQERRRDWLKKGRGKTEFRKIDGAVYSYEVAKSDQGWHPHLHMIVTLNEWIDLQKLSAEWENITGDSKIIWAERIQGDPVPAMLEVFKYTVKFADLPLADNLLAYKTLRKRRLLGSFGSFRGLKLPDNLTEDTIDDLPFNRLHYKYDQYRRVYDLLKFEPEQPPKNASQAAPDSPCESGPTGSPFNESSASETNAGRFAAGSLSSRRSGAPREGASGSEKARRRGDAVADAIARAAQCAGMRRPPPG